MVKTTVSRVPILGDCRFIQYFPMVSLWLDCDGLYQPEIPWPISPCNVESRNLAFRVDECPIENMCLCHDYEGCNGINTGFKWDKWDN